MLIRHVAFSFAYFYDLRHTLSFRRAAADAFRLCATTPVKKKYIKVKIRLFFFFFFFFFRYTLPPILLLMPPGVAITPYAIC